MSLNLEGTDKTLKDLELNNGSSLEKISVVFDVDFVDTDFLEVDFGAKLKLEDVQKQPNVKIPNVKDSEFLTLVMLDPDAPNKQNPTAKVRNFLVTCNDEHLIELLNYKQYCKDVYDRNGCIGWLLTFQVMENSKMAQKKWNLPHQLLL